MNRILSCLTQRRARRLRRKVEALEREAEFWRQEQRSLSLAAYHLDMMKRPLTWGRLQNDANLAGHLSREYLSKAKALQAEIENHERSK